LEYQLMSFCRTKTTRALMVLVVALLSLQLVAGRLRTNTGSTGGGGTGGGGGTTMVPAIPEPASFAVFALGAGLVGLAVRRKRSV
jgi:hypothetical protein